MTEAAGSLEKSLADLEWDRLSRAVLARCVGPRGQGAPVPVARTMEGTAKALAETAEVERLLDEGESLPLDGVPDVRAALARVSREGALDGISLRDIARTLGVARGLRRFVGARKDRLASLSRALFIDPTLDGLEEELSRNIGADGLLFDHASDELRRLRVETANLRARITRRLEEMIIQREAVLQDAFYTLREGRYVLPVRRDSHERIEGIVHGTSASGATVFVEPEVLIGQGNRLKMALAEQEREEARILGVLSEFVAERHPEVVAAVDAIDHADLRQASARLGRDLDARVLPLDPEAELHLEAARHPLLLLDGADVVPNDLSIGSGRALILSGPNAGGKTVALKTMGLAAVMMRAGLPVPAAAGSRCGFFDPILSDVGDEQSIEKNLSTFSAHVTNLRRVIDEAGPRALVLLDELTGGTDPGEGAALACAIAEALCDAGAAIGVTTHYEPLKALATRDTRFRNAAVGFDVERMRPTFELTLDVPGASSALWVALRFGIREDIVTRAREVLPEHSRTFDELVRALELHKRRAVEELAAAEEAHARATALRDEAEAALAALRARDRAKVGREAERLLEDLRRGRAELKEARRQILQAKSEADLEQTKRALEEATRAAEAAREHATPPEQAAVPSGAPVGSPTIGERVYVAHLRSTAEVIEGPTRGRVRVAAGPLKLWVDVSELRRIDKGEPAPTRAVTPVEAAPPAEPTRVIPTADTTLDVRGMRVDDALAMTEQFIDRAYGQTQSTVFILHGVGSGALRDAVRQHLAADKRYVRSVRPATPEEGGVKLTVVTLR